MARDVLTYSIGNAASTTLSSSITDSDTSAPLTSDTNFNAKSGEGMALIDEGAASEELAYATGKAGASLTIPVANRGLEGGSAAAHSSGASVKGVLTAGMWNDVIDSLTNVLVKSTGAVDTTKIVTPTGTQTLTNKTLTSPTVNTPTVQNFNGWNDANETWTYASADDPTYTFTVAGVDLTSKYSAGMRVKLTQSTGGTKYFIITAVAFSTDTTITVYGGTDYDLANEAISSPFYSTQKAPQGFPLDPDKWTVEALDTTARSQTTPTADTWYNLGSFSIDIPIGAWDTYYQVNIQASDNADEIGVKATLSTANNSESDVEWTTYDQFLADGSTNAYHHARVYARKNITIAAKDTYYLNTLTLQTGTTGIENRNDRAPAIIRAVSAYL